MAIGFFSGRTELSFIFFSGWHRRQGSLHPKLQQKRQSKRKGRTQIWLDRGLIGQNRNVIGFLFKSSSQSKGPKKTLSQLLGGGCVPKRKKPTIEDFSDDDSLDLPPGNKPDKRQVYFMGAIGNQSGCFGA